MIYLKQLIRGHKWHITQFVAHSHFALESVRYASDSSSCTKLNKKNKNRSRRRKWKSVRWRRVSLHGYTCESAWVHTSEPAAAHCHTLLCVFSVNTPRWKHSYYATIHRTGSRTVPVNTALWFVFVWTAGVWLYPRHTHTHTHTHTLSLTQTHSCFTQSGFSAASTAADARCWYTYELLMFVIDTCKCCLMFPMHCSASVWVITGGVRAVWRCICLSMNRIFQQLSVCQNLSVIFIKKGSTLNKDRDVLVIQHITSDCVTFSHRNTQNGPAKPRITSKFFILQLYVYLGYIFYFSLVVSLCFCSGHF